VRLSHRTVQASHFLFQSVGVFVAMKKYGTLPGPLALICMGAALLAWQIHDWNPSDVYGMRLARSAIAMLFIAGAIIWRRLSTEKVPPGGSLVVKGSLKMDDLDELHDIQLPPDPCYTTVGGFLLERLGHAPLVGEFVDFSGYRFSVAEIDRQTISRVRIQELTGRAHEKNSVRLESAQ
jgi:hypothetical protein